MPKKTVLTADELYKPNSILINPPRKISKIILHCSDSFWGDFAAIDNWHKERWKGIVFAGKRIYCGYHYVILNGYRSPRDAYVESDDGLIEKGRPDDYIGAHCKGQNMHSLGICLIGKHVDKFTYNQFEALSRLLNRLYYKYGASIHPHNEFSTKTCPNFNFKDFYRRWLGGYWD